MQNHISWLCGTGTPCDSDLRLRHAAVGSPEGVAVCDVCSGVNSSFGSRRSLLKLCQLHHSLACWEFVHLFGAPFFCSVKCYCGSLSACFVNSRPPFRGGTSALGPARWHLVSTHSPQQGKFFVFELNAVQGLLWSSEVVRSAPHLDRPTAWLLPHRAVPLAQEGRKRLSL